MWKWIPQWAVVILLAWSPTAISADGPPPRLKVSENKRFLVTQDGKPFFCWPLFENWTGAAGGPSDFWPQGHDRAEGAAALESVGDIGSPKPRNGWNALR